MGTTDPDILDEQVEARLRASAPQPRPEFVLALRTRLFPERALATWRRRHRPVFVGALASAAAAVAVLVLVSAGPLAGGGGQDVKAGSNCRYVVVKARGRVPVVVRTRAGQTRIVYRDEPVERPVERCR